MYIPVASSIVGPSEPVYVCTAGVGLGGGGEWMGEVVVELSGLSTFSVVVISFIRISSLTNIVHLWVQLC